MAVRIKWKMTQNFSLWAEGLYPIHRHHWIAIDPDDSSKNFFSGYDLQHKIPDPVTREAAVGEPKYGTRLQRKWEYSILATSPRERILERKRLSTMKDWDKKVGKGEQEAVVKQTGSQPKGTIIPADLNLDDEEAPESDPEEDFGPERGAFTKENNRLTELNLTSTVSKVNFNINLLTEFDKLTPLKKRELSGQALANGHEGQPPLSQNPKRGQPPNNQLANVEEHGRKPT